MPKKSMIFWGTLFALFLLAFFYLEQSRSALYGRFPDREDGSWRSLTMQSLSTLSNWKEKGFWNLRAQQYLVPLDRFSYPDQSSYISYPPTYLFPVALWNFVTQSAPSLEQIMKISAFSQWILIFCIVAIAARFWKNSFSELQRFLLFSALGLYLFWNFPAARWFQQVWWPDVAGVIGLYGFLLLFLLPEFPYRRHFFLLSAFLVGTLDWYCLVAAFLFLLILGKEIPGKRWHAFLAFAVGAILYPLSLVLDRRADDLWNRFQFRSGNMESPPNVPFHQLTSNLYLDLGKLTEYALFPCLLLCLWVVSKRAWRRRIEGRIILALWLGLGLHYLATSQHYLEHHYEFLKFTPAIALTFVCGISLIPWERAKWLPVFLFVLFSSLVCVQTYSGMKDVVAESRSVSESETKMCLWLQKNTSQEDLVYSPNLTIDRAEARFGEDAGQDYRLVGVCHRSVYFAGSQAEWIERSDMMMDFLMWHNRGFVGQVFLYVSTANSWMPTDALLAAEFEGGKLYQRKLNIQERFPK